MKHLLCGLLLVAAGCNASSIFGGNQGADRGPTPADTRPADLASDPRRSYAIERCRALLDTGVGCPNGCNPETQVCVPLPTYPPPFGNLDVRGGSRTLGKVFRLVKHDFETMKVVDPTPIYLWINPDQQPD